MSDNPLFQALEELCGFLEGIEGGWPTPRRPTFLGLRDVVYNVPQCGTLMVLHERRSPPYNQPSAMPAKYHPAAVPQKRDCGMSFDKESLWLHIDVLHWPTMLIPCINIK